MSSDFAYRGRNAVTEGAARVEQKFSAVATSTPFSKSPVEATGEALPDAATITSGSGMRRERAVANGRPDSAITADSANTASKPGPSISQIASAGKRMEALAVML